MNRASLSALMFVAIMAGSVLASGCSDTVRLPDCVDCRPVEMKLDQTLEVDLGSSREVSGDPNAHEWLVTDAGTMEIVSEKRGTRPEDENEFRGGYSTYVVFRLEPTELGSTHVLFELLPTGSAGESVDTLDITVNVTE